MRSCFSTMVVSLSMVPQFKGDGLGTGFVIERIVTIDGKKFVPLPKGDRKIERLLASGCAEKGFRTERLLARSTLLETLLDLRASKGQEVFDQLKPQAAKVDLGFNKATDSALSKADYIRTKQLAPKIVTIIASTVGPAQGISINVAFEVHNKPPLVVELSENVINYLVTAVSHQIANNLEKKHSIRDVDRPELVSGVSKVLCGKHAGKYRVRCRSADGKRRRVQFGAGSPTQAVEKARGIIAAIDSGRGSVHTADADEIEELEEEEIEDDEEEPM